MDQAKDREGRLFNFMPFLLIFVLCTLYFSSFGDYITYYQEKNSLFVFSKDYLANYLNQPGSLLIYIGNFLSTFFYFPFTGAVVIGLLISFSGFIVSRITKLLSGKISYSITILFSAILFYFQTSYQFSVFNTTGLALQLLLFYMVIKYSKLWLGVILFPVWYFITGAWSWVFILLFAARIIVSSFRSDWYKIIIIIAVGSLTILILEKYLLFQTTKALVEYPFSENIKGLQTNLFMLFVLFTGLIPVVARIRLIRFGPGMKNSLLVRLLPFVAIIMFIVPLSVFRFDKRTRQYFHTEKLFIKGLFDQVIDYNKKHPSNNILTIYLDNIALCETGRLNDLLFSFPQDPEGRTLFLNWEMSGEILRRGAYFYYTIGMINEAHRWAYENMIMSGLRPEDLKMLVKTELINGNQAMASKYISIMRRTLFYRKDAKMYESLVSDDKLVDADAYLGLKRKEEIQHDFFSITDNPYMNVERILSMDSVNRKAFEYKLAFMLLRKDYQGIEGELKNLARQGFQRIPVHIDEATEAYKTLKLGPVPEQGYLKPNPQTAVRFKQFLQTFQQNGNNLKSAEPALRRQFGNTFWYYAFYR
jgi:hypothetical protein